jgi:predicted outer membrane repeat protein
VRSAAAPTSLSEHAIVRAVFNRAVTVTSFADGPGSASTPGTLRHALTNAQDGDLISFSGVGTVELASALPAITKSITLEGNGATLTRATSWTASSTSQLLRITNSTAEVLVRRLHFKDGRSAGSGGAITNGGILSLESCIFSGNQTTGNNGAGGAVYSGNTLSIRGCTFYGNSAGGRGGAVYFSGSWKILTLTGNLFYGNTAPEYPVVYYSVTGTTVPSYNVVDLAFGEGIPQAGWTAGTGDKTFAALSIMDNPFDTTTFAPVAALQTLLTTAPADFPVTDFNGENRTFPGAPGAVK